MRASPCGFCLGSLSRCLFSTGADWEERGRAVLDRGTSLLAGHGKGFHGSRKDSTNLDEMQARKKPTLQKGLQLWKNSYFEPRARLHSELAA